MFWVPWLMPRGGGVTPPYYCKISKTILMPVVDGQSHFLIVFQQKPLWRLVIYAYLMRNNVHKQQGQREPNPGVPNANYIPPARIGGRVESARLFGYRHVGIGNATYSRWGSYPMRAPNPNPFAFWGNIGLRV